MDFNKEYIKLYESVKSALKEAKEKWSDEAIAEKLGRERTGIWKKMKENKIEEEDYAWLKYKFGYLFRNSTDINSSQTDQDHEQALKEIALSLREFADYLDGTGRKINVASLSGSGIQQVKAAVKQHKGKSNETDKSGKG